ncbi:DUF3429 domain-containing protein [Phenylobacterium sp.]|uniref:DUF3429 domain-containing protein n=1 Tax=Phenylobacterium sp. TaxID=1871053 RepID=UPI00286D3ADF|nr:DUF3429 domain-containing protein [Phenylobacterium sp.]
MTDRSDPAGRDDAIPLALWLIALTALAPFPLAAVAYGWGAPEIARPALTVILTWSGVVLAFLGGVRWGMETVRPAPRAVRLLISVLSPVVAWVLLASRRQIPDGWIIGGCIFAFLVQWLFDHQAPDVPARYPKLSTALTAGACISLAVCLDQAMKTGHV